MGADAVWTVLLLSVTVTVKAEAPMTVGVPEIAPVVGEMDRPWGRLPEVIDQA